MANEKYFNHTNSSLSWDHYSIAVAETQPKAPLCKGSWQKSLIFD